MTKLVLHFGMHKTGTSSLQRYMRTNRLKLIMQGVYYPKEGLKDMSIRSADSSEGGHTHFITTLKRPWGIRSKRLLSMISKSTNENDCNTVFISSETFFLEIETIHKKIENVLLKRFSTIEILVYLRRQDLWAKSFYKEILTWAGRRETRNFQKFSDNLYSTGTLDYYHKIGLLKKLFPNSKIIVRSYEDRLNPDIVEDIFSATNLKVDTNFIAKKDNPSIPNGLIDFMRGLNQKHITSYQKSLVTREIYRQIERKNVQEKIDYNNWSFLTYTQKKNLHMRNLKLIEKFKISPSALLSENFSNFDSKNKVTYELSTDAECSINKLFKRKKGFGKRFLMNDGSWGISVFANENIKVLAIFLDYHIFLGVDKIICFLDNPEDEILSVYKNNRVKFIKCDDSFWYNELGKLPSNRSEKLKTCHNLGLAKLRTECGIDWAINLDTNELLWVTKSKSIKEILRRESETHNQILLFPMEALGSLDEDIFMCRKFKSPFFNIKDIYLTDKNKIKLSFFKASVQLLRLLTKVPIFGRRLTRILSLFSSNSLMTQRALNLNSWNKHFEKINLQIYQNYSHLIKDGFLGDSLHRTISSRDFHIDPLTSLNEHKNTNSKAYCSSIHSEMRILHFDTVCYKMWKATGFRQEYGSEKEAQIKTKREKQQLLFRSFQKNKDLRSLYARLYPQDQKTLDFMTKWKLLEQFYLPSLDDICKKWR